MTGPFYFGRNPRINQIRVAVFYECMVDGRALYQTALLYGDTEEQAITCLKNKLIVQMGAKFIEVTPCETIPNEIRRQLADG